MKGKSTKSMKGSGKAAASKTAGKKMATKKLMTGPGKDASAMGYKKGGQTKKK